MSKTMNNSNTKGTKTQVKDVEFWGNGDLFKLISKASSKNEGWMKSTKAMHIENIGCVIQVTTQQGDNVAEALTFVPQVKIVEIKEKDKVISREIVKDFREIKLSEPYLKTRKLGIKNEKARLKLELKHLDIQLKELSE